MKPEELRPERSGSPAPDDTSAHPAEARLWERFLARENLAAALRRVEQNAGAPGIDGMSTKELRPWLHRHWSEVRSALDVGTFRPQAVRRVMIPKPSGGRRALGVPTAVDRLICQALLQVLTPLFDPHFHPHSFGFRPGRSAHQAVMRARHFVAEDARAWCVDLDLDSFFDEVPWNLIVRAVEAVTDCRWVLLYVKRWLQAPMQQRDGALSERSKGTPQGSAISPLLANLFMHFAFDLWMVRNYPGCPFERYADDAVVHCESRRQAQAVLSGIAARIEEVGLRLHPGKTRIVYCKDSNRHGEHEHTSFTFLGFAFRPRAAVNRASGVYFTSFQPAISPEALKATGAVLRELRIGQRLHLSLGGLARWLKPIVAGWMNYYGRYYRSGLYPLLRRINSYLRRWAWKKYRRLRTCKRFKRWWTALLAREPDLFAHWRWVRSYDGAVRGAR